MDRPEEVVPGSGRALEQSRELLERSTAILAEVKQLQASLEGLRAELTSHDQQLRDTLGRLQEEREHWMRLLGGRQPVGALAAAVKEEWSTPPSGFIDPQGLPFPWELPPAEKPAEPALAAGPPVRRERRSFSRRSGNLSAVDLRGLEPDSKTSSGWVLDRSLGGLGILINEPAKIGDVLTVRPANAPEQAPWVQIEVRHCQPLGGCWRIGCRFVDLLSQEQVRLFG